VRETVRALLANDATLAVLLTGGVWAATEISRQNTPGAFDANGELMPCALVKLESEGPSGPFVTSSRLFVLVMFYERSGYTAIDAAVARAYTLLHYVKVGTDVWEMRHAGDVLDLEDQALECSLGMSRFGAVRKR
jgi:hypothetical protein